MWCDRNDHFHTINLYKKAIYENKKITSAYCNYCCHPTFLHPAKNMIIHRLAAAPNDSTVTTIKVFATGLNNPRGLKFGPDGNLYVAEGGTGGTHFLYRLPAGASAGWPLHG
jgi:glucose/arabinose dehydrogenase